MSDVDGLTRYIDAIEWWRKAWPDSPPPTSSITGAGAVGALERRLSEVTGRRFALVTSSGSAALLAAVRSVAPSKSVITVGSRWPGDHETLASGGFSTCRVARLCDVPTSGLVAIVAAGVLLDELASIAHRFPGQPVVADQSDQPPSQWRCAAWATVLSFGPGKYVDAGEGGAVLTDFPDIYKSCMTTQHPARQAAAGLVPNCQRNERIHPVAAVTALHQLSCDAVLAR